MFKILKKIFIPERGEVKIVERLVVLDLRGTDRGYPVMAKFTTKESAELWISEKGWPGSEYCILPIYEVRGGRCLR